jgi:hypothetical protein
MIGLLCFVLTVLASPFKSKLRLQAENAVLRHQLNVVKRRLPGRVRLTNCVSAPNIDPSYCPICRYYPKLPLPMTIPCRLLGRAKRVSRLARREGLWAGRALRSRAVHNPGAMG